MPTLQQFVQDSVSNLQLEPIRLDPPVLLQDLSTPALTIDLDVFDANLAKMQDYLTTRGMDLRCHTKMHKSPVIAKKQLANGAIGVCCATVSEAEVMLASGIEDILITSPVVTKEKVLRVISLARESTGIEIVVDHIKGADLFEREAANADISLNVLVDLDPGMGRTGIQPGQDALNLAQHITGNCSSLRFKGLQMYIGNCMHTSGFDARCDKYTHLLQKGIETRLLLESEGINVPVFTGGGTGTYNIDGNIGELTDLQAGSYAFMDVEYRDIGGQGSERFVDFEPSLFALVTAISKPQERLITVDAGIKSLATDTAYPELRDIEGVVYHFAGDEHGIIQLNNPSKEIRLGDKLQVLAPHCDPTVNLYDFYYPYRNDVVEELWPISARGRSQ